MLHVRSALLNQRITIIAGPNEAGKTTFFGLYDNSSSEPVLLKCGENT